MPAYSSAPSANAQYVVKRNALEVIFFHPCDTVEDFHKPRIQFSPLFCHHFFGETEQVAGDEDLKIRIFYIPDTFEAFLKVEGRPVLLEEESKVESTWINGGNASGGRGGVGIMGGGGSGELVRSKRTVLECLLERTPFPGGFCNSQAEFIQRLKNRKQVFVPPGEVVAECMLGKEFLQIRECTFAPKQEIPSVINIGESAVAGPSATISSSTATVALPLSFSPTISYSSSSVELSAPTSYKFDSLHRRIEWFLHWFIESASPIDHDCRWRILLPYIVKGKHHISHPWVSQNTLMTYVQRKLNEHFESNEEYMENKRKSNADGINNKETEKKKKKEESSEVIEKRGGKSGGGHQLHMKKTANGGDGCKRENESSIITSENNLLNDASAPSLVQSRSKRLKKGVKTEEENEYSWHLAGMASTYTFFTINKDRRRISQFMVFPHMQSKGIGMKLLEHIYTQAMLDDDVTEITVEDPAVSFSQLRDVVSLKLCFDSAFLSKYYLYTNNLRKNVKNNQNENISLFYNHLDYINSRDKQSHNLSKMVKNERNKKQNKEEKNEKENEKQNNAEEGRNVSRELPDKKLIIAIIKETYKQATRILDTLRLANVIPHPMPPPPTLLSTPLEIKSEIPRDWRTANIKIDHMNALVLNNNAFNKINSNIVNMTKNGSNKNVGTNNTLLINDNNINKIVDDLFCESNACKDLRICVKKRMRKEYMDELSEISATGIRGELDYRWREHYAVLYRTVRKLRLIFPL